MFASENHLLSLIMNSSSFPQFLLNGSRLMLISNLPNDSYTEADVANLLIPFGFEYHFHTIYVVPQSHMVSTQLLIIHPTTENKNTDTFVCLFSFPGVHHHENSCRCANVNEKLPTESFYFGELSAEFWRHAQRLRNVTSKNVSSFDWQRYPAAFFKIIFNTSLSMSL